MTDYFAVFGEPRRPWLDPEFLKQQFLELSSRVHPDRAHGLNSRQQKDAQDRYTELNAAYQCLREPRSRLRHLLTLERSCTPSDIQQIPSALMDLFMETGQTLRRADESLSRKSHTSSSILKAQWFEGCLELTDQLQALQTRLNGQRDRLITEVRAIDSAWMREPGRPPELLERTETIYRQFGYYDRWLSQVQERLYQIAL